MARLTPKDSPRGFWPNPDKEFFYKTQTPPWKVPKKRKSRGSPTRFTRLNNNKIEGEEVITRNRFGLLSNSQDLNDNSFINEHEDFKYAEADRNEIQEIEKRSPVQSQEANKLLYNISSFSDFDSFMYYCRYNRERFYVSKNYSMYNDNKYRCAGYFPDFIIPEDFSHYQFITNKHNPYYF